MAKHIITVENLFIHFLTFYGNAKVINDVSIHVSYGEVVGLVGETGCGKSVMAKTILGALDIPPGRVIGGKIILEGENILGNTASKNKRKPNRTISYVPQDPMTALNPTFTIGQQLIDLIKWQHKNISFMEFIGIRNRSTSQQRSEAINIIEKVHIPSGKEILNKYPIQLSGGMRQRILIGMALIGAPKLLICDEPTTALDVTIQKSILALIEEKIHSANLSVIYITHDLGIANRICDRIYVMYAGEIVEYANSNELVNEPQHPYTIGLLNSRPKLAGWSFEGIEGKLCNYLDPPLGCRFHPRCDRAAKKCTETKPDMVQISDTHFAACHMIKL